MLSDDEISHMLEEMYLYDNGQRSLSEGNELMRGKLREAIDDGNERKPHQLISDRIRLILSRYVRDHYLTEEALAQGYGIEDVAEFIRWLDDYGVSRLWY